MTALSNSLAVSEHRPSLRFWTGSHIKSGKSLGSTSLAFEYKGNKTSFSHRRVVIRSSYSDGGRLSSASSFIGGFVIGGLIVGTMGCVYAPQISKALTGSDKKDLMKKLPKFIYDEDKYLENQRKKIAAKIEQINSAMDTVSDQLRSGTSD